MCAHKGMKLRKWCSNHPILLQNIAVEDQEVNLDFASESDEAIKPLGLLWLPKGDQFCIRANPSSQIPSTKRKITS